MATLMVLATAGAGGDLPPLMAVTLGLRERGHRIVFVGDRRSAELARNQGLDGVALAAEHDLGPRLVQAVREAQALPPNEQGGHVDRRLEEWSAGAAEPVQRLLEERRPDLLLTSLFGVPITGKACAQSSTPWVVVNSTFYVGPNPPRPLEEDFSPRAVPLFRHLVRELGHAALVLHATDARFDYDHTDLPPRNYYVGPLFWEEPTPTPACLDEPGAPWVLVTISSQLQDDMEIVRQTLRALAERPVRVLLTIGPGHSPEELDAIPPNARVEHYVSHDAVLHRSALLISHAGHGSVMKALWYGAPMVLIPWGRDQPGVAARATRLRAAVVVERDRLQPDILRQAVDTVLAGSYRDAAREVSQWLRTEDPVGAACDYIETIGLRAD